MDCDIKLSNCSGIKVRLEGDDVFDAQFVNQREGITKVVHVPLKMCQVNPLNRDIVLLEMSNNIPVDPALVLCPDMVNILDHSPLVEIVVLSAKLQKVLGGIVRTLIPLSLCAVFLKDCLLG